MRIFLLFTTSFLFIGNISASADPFSKACKNIHIGVTYTTGTIFEAVSLEEEVLYRKVDADYNVHRLTGNRKGKYGYEHLGNGLSELSKDYALTPTEDGFLIEDSLDHNGDYAVISVDLSSMQSERIAILTKQVGPVGVGERQHSARAPYRNKQFWTYPVGNGGNILVLDLINLHEQTLVDKTVIHGGQHRGLYIDDSGEILAAIRFERANFSYGLHFKGEFYSLVDNYTSLYPISRHPITGQPENGAVLIRRRSHSRGPNRISYSYELLSLITDINSSEPKLQEIEEFVFDDFEYDAVSQQFLWFKRTEKDSDQSSPLEIFDKHLTNALQELQKDGWKRIRFQSATSDYSKVIFITANKDNTSYASGYTLLDRKSSDAPYTLTQLCYSEEDDRKL